jgi:hypothetical protein
MKKLKLSEIIIKNTTSTDMYLRDAYGAEHIIYPEQVKKVMVIKDKAKLGQKNG